MLSVEKIHEKARVLGYVVGYIDGAVSYRYVGSSITEEEAKSVVSAMSTKEFAEYIKTYDADSSNDFMEALSETMGLDVFGVYLDANLCIRRDGHKCSECAIKSDSCSEKEKISLSEYWSASHRKMLKGE
jgi:hypothetical protein